MSYIYNIKQRAIMMQSFDFADTPIIYRNDGIQKVIHGMSYEMFSRKSLLNYLWKTKGGSRVAVLFKDNNDDVVLQRLKVILGLDLRRGWDGYYRKIGGRWVLAFVLSKDEEEHFLKNSYPPIDFRFLDVECSSAFFLPSKFSLLFCSKNQNELLRYYTNTLGRHGCVNASWCLLALLYFSQTEYDKKAQCLRALYDFENILGVDSKMLLTDTNPLGDFFFSSLEDELLLGVSKRYEIV